MSSARGTYDVTSDARFFCDDEHFDYLVYKELARKERNGQRRGVQA